MIYFRCFNNSLTRAGLTITNILDPSIWKLRLHFAANVTGSEQTVSWQPAHLRFHWQRKFPPARFRLCEFLLKRNFASVDAKFVIAKMTAKFPLTQRNFKANFRRIFARTKDEIRRISLSLLRHSTVRVRFQSLKVNSYRELKLLELFWKRCVNSICESWLHVIHW